MPDIDVRTQRLFELRLEAEHARNRLDLYRARAYGLRPVSETRMRELEHAAEAADERLRHARQNASRA